MQRLSYDEKLSRLRKFLLLLAEACSNSKVPTSAASYLAEQGFLEKIGRSPKEVRYFSHSLDKIDDITWQLMVDVAFSSKSKKPKEKEFAPPTGEHLQFTPVPVSEQISYHLAKIGELLSVQFNSSTPPGAYQEILRLREKIRELEKEKEELEEALRPFKKLAEKMKGL